MKMARPKTDTKTRILNKIKIDDNGCWLLPPSNNKYAYLAIDKKYKRAHKVSYETFKEQVPEGLLVLHHCDIKNCVCPEHLYVGTAKDNYEDTVKRGQAILGQDVYNAKLTNAQAEEIRNLYKTNKYSYADLALIFKVST